ncbi:arylesterase [Methyloraptor flagellatus]|uniref:arylesterase n=1 Tax=Methyloraptor flagellatus TaxID=3162530 RepID=UPI00387DC5C4
MTPDAPLFPSRRIVLASLAGLVGAAVVSRGARAAGRPVKLVAFGDSLTAGYGLPDPDGFTSRLEAALRAKGHAVEVVNAGVSGDTTDMGLARLDWSVPDDADAVIVELGANDALRGLPPAAARDNMDAIVGRLRAKKLPVLVAGMYAPRNLGEPYAKAFDPLFAAIAEKHGALLYPFFLDGVAGDRTLNQPDGIHPNAAGVKIIVERILPKVEELLGQVKAKAG